MKRLWFIPGYHLNLGTLIQRLGDPPVWFGFAYAVERGVDTLIMEWPEKGIMAQCYDPNGGHILEILARKGPIPANTLVTELDYFSKEWDQWGEPKPWPGLTDH